ncbi:MAG: malate dehydrogenase [Bacteroidales bacterium]|nr:malate dehydrogenase [Bacteroidales bacterium]
MSKVSIIGAGEVGASCATCLAERDFVNEIVLLDIKQGVAEGKALDLRQSAALKRFDTIIRGFTNDYSAVTKSDVVVITSGIPRKPGMERSDLITTNASIVQDVCKQIAKHAPDSIIVVVSNPLDVLCYCALKSSGFPDNRVMGMSGLLDVARYKSFIAEVLNVSTKDIQALILGGHGKTMVPMPRYTTIGGIPIRNLLSEDKVQEAIHRTQMGGEEIINHLGRSGWFAAGAAICEMVESIICDQRRVFPACAYLKGEYGLNDIYIGVPVILGANGVEKVIELELDEDDKIRFYESVQVVKENVGILKREMD